MSSGHVATVPAIGLTHTCRRHGDRRAGYRHPADRLRQIQAYADAGCDELYLTNMGPHALDMIEFYGTEVLPTLA